MDQMASNLGEAGQLLALLCRPAEVQGLVQIPEGLEFWGIDSGHKHAVGGHAGDAADYGSVRVGAFMGKKIWNTDNYKFHGSITGHANWVRCARFSPDSSMIVSCGDDKSVRLWDTERRTSVCNFFDNKDIVTKTQFHPDGSAVEEKCFSSTD